MHMRLLSRSKRLAINSSRWVLIKPSHQHHEIIKLFACLEHFSHSHQGFQIEQYLHGPFVATTHGTHVCFTAPIANEGSSTSYGYNRTQDLIKVSGLLVELMNTSRL